MSHIFSPHTKYLTWRKLWIALAKCEKVLGLPISDHQIEAMEKNVETIDFALVREFEKEMRHDVMAHIHAFGAAAPEAKGIIHWGATSAFVTDNGDLIQIRSALQLLKGKLLFLLKKMRTQSHKYAATPTLSYTHLQPAQPTTVGKRISLWLQDFYFDTHDLYQREKELLFLGVKGATGTQASFLTLFNGDHQKVEELDRLLAKEFGFSHLLLLSGQTYTRKQDIRVLSVLEGLAASSHKCATDLRLLSHLGEMGEGHSSTQVGSSAMPHKKNPILSERVCALSRLLISLCQNPSYTLATQWLERSLDDSANRRLVIPEAFLIADALLNLLIEIFTHLDVDQKRIEKNLTEQLPFLSLENILMYAIKGGKDRQKAHEELRKDPSKGREVAKHLGLSDKEIEASFTPNTGRAKEQVFAFFETELDPFLEFQGELSVKLHPVSF